MGLGQSVLFGDGEGVDRNVLLGGRGSTELPGKAVIFCKPTCTDNWSQSGFCSARGRPPAQPN